MPTKKRHTRSVKSLKAKGLSSKQAKSVQGGIIVVCRPLNDKVMSAGAPNMPQGAPTIDE